MIVKQLLFVLPFLLSCSSNDSETLDMAVPRADLHVPRFDGPRPDGLSPSALCNLPGAIQFTGSGTVEIPGGVASPNLSFLHLPVGFCAHYYGNVGNARQIRVAPGGELFVASPTTATGGGGPNGQAAIVVLPDDDLDGYADAPVSYLSNLPSTQGLLFSGSYFYYQDHTSVMRVPYSPGDRAPSGTSATLSTVNVYVDVLHWPKTFDITDDGKTIYIGNGGAQDDLCPLNGFHGGILGIDATAPAGSSPAQVATGFRNPIAVRCHRGFGQCYAVELALDGSGNAGGREKVVPIRNNDDWGYPCCATTNTPYGTVTSNPDCSKVASESAAFIIGETPFGIDFESGTWPAPWTKNLFIVLHGKYGSWKGARVVGVPTDPVTGAPMSSSDLSGQTKGLTDFATGWDDHSLQHGRPAAITFAPDGRLFVANDNNGDIFWIAPL
jgi:glucose/arabinose dehydrogenase